ncbi:MAG: Lrp/AsnC family transcriptional regulator [Acidimicrobiales bacterium]|nr:Lrp/AsnC family transcriptional regulator [Hyphomonadaceae bacterium]RZV41712.1 MAG: Lrp/AsnC family transcriptional regulator [Acidimicrobiales bacterium]
MALDQIDQKIISMLQIDCRQPIADIAEKIGLSPSACHRRIGILEKNSVIEGYKAQINGDKLGYHIAFYVEVSLESQSEQVLAAFEAAVQARPQILECYLMTGSADYLLKVAAENTREYERIYRRIIAALPHVSGIQSSLVMKQVKRWAGYPSRS